MTSIIIISIVALICLIAFGIFVFLTIKFRDDDIAPGLGIAAFFCLIIMIFSVMNIIDRADKIDGYQKQIVK